MTAADKTDILERYTGVDRASWPIVGPFGLLSFLITAGIEIGRIGRDSYFLTVAGADDIPSMYVYIALISLILAGTYNFLVPRISGTKILITILGSGALVFGAIGLAMSHGWKTPQFFPYVLFCGVDAYLLFLLMHFWALANDSFSVWEGKRFYPFIGAAGMAGTIAGAASTKYASYFFGANSLLPIWSLLLLATIILTARMSSSLTLESEAVEPCGTEGMIKGAWRTPLMRTLTYMAFPMWVMIYVIEFSYYEASARVFVDQDLLAQFFGMFICLSSCLGLLAQLTITRWALNRKGVGATALLYPLAMTFGAVCLLIFSLVPAAHEGSLDLLGPVLLVLLARFCDIGIYYAVFDPAQQLMFYAVDSQARARARAFIAGVVFPCSIAAAGGLLLAFKAFNEPIHNTSFVAVVLGFLLIILALNITPEYLKALLATCKPGDNESRAQVMEEIGRLQQSDIQYVLLDTVQATELEEARFALTTLLENRDEHLLDDLAEILDQLQEEVLLDLRKEITAKEAEFYPEFVAKLDSKLKTQAL